MNVHCKRNELCYTLLNGHDRLVKRGCVSKPIFNSFYYYCKDSLCNNRQIAHPYIQQHSGSMFLKNLYRNLHPRISLLDYKSDGGMYIHATSIDKIVMKLLSAVLICLCFCSDRNKS